MVLAELGGSITRALHKMNNTTVIDEKALTDCLNEINRALLQSDVRFELIRDMQINIKNIVNLEQLAAGHNKRKIIQQVTDYFYISCLFIKNCIIYYLCIVVCCCYCCRLCLTNSAECWILENHLLFPKEKKQVLLCLLVYKVCLLKLHV